MTVRQPGEPYDEWIARSLAAAQPTTFDPDLVPDVESYSNPESLEIDRVLETVDIVAAYILWCNKSEPVPGNKREGIKVSCPSPNHPDNHPSAWLNLDKGDGGVGTCGSCNIGFDKYDLFAWHSGLPVPEYKTHFNEVKKAMAVALGYTVSTTAGRTFAVAAPEPEPEQESAQVISLYPNKKELQELAQDDFEPPNFNWRLFPAITPGTFLHEWLTITSETELPEEYFFWLGLQALGLAVGNDVRLASNRPYRANLMVCLVGPPAAGKTAAINEFTHLMHEALPFKPEIGNGGALLTQRIASGEGLIDKLSIKIDDGTGNKVQLPVRAMVTDAELSALMARSNRNGNTLKETMQDFYDSTLPVSGHSVTSGSREVQNHFVSFITSTQHERIKDLLHSRDEASGFISRWVFAYGKAKPRPVWDATVIDTSPCVDLLRTIRAWAGKPRMVSFHDPKAFQRWERFFLTVLNPIIVQTQAANLVRLDLMCRKILLLLAINDRSTSVTVEHMQTLELLWPYLTISTGAVHEAISTDPINLLMDRIEALVKAFHDRRQQWPTRRDLGRSFSGNRKDFDYALEALLRDGRLIELLIKPTAAGGRPTIRYRLATAEDPSPILVAP